MARFEHFLFLSTCQFMLAQILVVSASPVDGSATPYKDGTFFPDTIHPFLDHVDPSATTADCGNATHHWNSVNGSCFDETFVDDEASTSLKRRNFFIRDLLCPEGLTSCWLVNCCRPGELCGSITEGCIISWSTIYTTTTTTYLASFTTTVFPHSPQRTTVTTVTEKEYVTSVFDTTLSGAGPETIYSTSTHTVSTTIASRYDAGPRVVTATITGKPLYTGPPSSSSSSDSKTAGELQRREQRTSYTTITKTKTVFKTAPLATATFSDDVLTRTLTLTQQETAVQTHTHYSQTNSFVLVQVDVTTTISDYAYGTQTDPGTITYTTTVRPGNPTDTKLAAEAAGATSGSSSQQHRKLSGGAIAGIVIGTLIGLLLLAALLFFGYLLLRRRRRLRRERKYEDTPSPPLPPSPQSPMTAINSAPALYHGNDDYGAYPRSPRSPHQNSFGDADGFVIPPAAAVVAGAGARNHHRRSSNHNRKGSRGSVVSVSPVPEEDEYENLTSPRGGMDSNRSSTDSIRWGRGYGGRGGFNSPVGRGGNRMSGPSGLGRNNRQFTDQPTTSYADEDLIPPHTRTQSQ